VVVVEVVGGGRYTKSATQGKSREGGKPMSDRLTAEPGTLEFLRQLLEIAQESDHPMDKALTKVLLKQIGEARAEERDGS